MEYFLMLGIVVIFSLLIVTLTSLANLKSYLERVENNLNFQIKTLRDEIRKGLPAKSEEKGVPTPLAPVFPSPTSASLPMAEQEPTPAAPPALAAREGVPATVVPPPLPKQPEETLPPGQAKVSAPCLERKETAVERIMGKIWNWIVVGEEFRKPGVPAEFAVAAAWLVRTGVIAVVIAVGFGLQLSIIGPAGRVTCALVCGSAFVGLGLRNMTKKLYLLGQGFIGGGMAMFYFAFFAASIRYNLMPLSVAYACMMVVTASAVLVAVRFNALSIAVLGALGGYLTPVMLSTSRGDLPGLSAYLLLLAVGILCVAIWRQWPLLTWLSFFLNACLFSAALFKYGTGGVLETIYVGLFFALFSTAMFIYPVFRRIKVTSAEILPLFLNATCALGWGWRIMETGDHPRMFLAYLSLGMAAFYVVHIWVFLYLRNFDRALLSAFIALTVIFIGIALPLLFTGNVLSTVFALQALAFLWLGGKLESKMFVRGALCLYLVVVARLLIGFFTPDAFEVGPETSYFQGLKDRVAEFVVPILSLFLASRCFKQLPAAFKHAIGDAGMRENNAFAQEFMAALTAFYAAFIAYVTMEAYSFSNLYMPSFADATISIVWCVLLFHLISMRKDLSADALGFLTMLAGCALLIQWLYWGWVGDHGLYVDKLCHRDPFSRATALPRLVSTAVCMAAILKIWDTFKREENQLVFLRTLAFYAVLAMGFLYLTFEAATFCTAYVPGFRRGAVSVVWGCYGLSLLVGGLYFERKALRMVGLTLFAVTLLKIFIVDLSKSEVLFRLIGFALVGMVLLLAAYAYLRTQDTFKVSDTEKK